MDLTDARRTHSGTVVNQADVVTDGTASAGLGDEPVPWQEKCQSRSRQITPLLRSSRETSTKISADDHATLA
jgi:hypothetical protein